MISNLPSSDAVVDQVVSALPSSDAVAQQASSKPLCLNLLATPVALHSTPVSHWLAASQFLTCVASRLASFFFRKCTSKSISTLNELLGFHSPGSGKSAKHWWCGQCVAQYRPSDRPGDKIHLNKYSPGTKYHTFRNFPGCPGWYRYPENCQKSKSFSKIWLWKWCYFGLTL